MYVHVGVATRVELVVTYIVPGKSEGNRSGLSHVATREGNHNGLSHSCLNAVPLHPQPLVVHHLPRCVVLRTGGRVGVKSFSRAITCMRMTY